MAVDEELLKGSALLQEILTAHKPPEEAGILFRAVAPKTAVFNHIIQMDMSDAVIETATRKAYSRPLGIGRELMTFVFDDDVSIVNQ